MQSLYDLGWLVYRRKWQRRTNCTNDTNFMETESSEEDFPGLIMWFEEKKSYFSFLNNDVCHSIGVKEKKNRESIF